MDYLYTLLEKRNLDSCLLPLWKLKITDNEFEELRSILEKCTHNIYQNNPFKSHQEECTLFFAEYWKRIYTDGKQNINDVFSALKSNSRNPDLIQKFYDAARNGANKLHIERYQGAMDQLLFDMLYQGGLPMKLISQGNTLNKWNRFAIRLVNKRINFQDLDLGLIAEQSQSIEEFCEQMISAIERNQYSKMPIHCENENDQVYQYLINLYKQERTRHVHSHPFSLSWIYDIDFLKKRFNVSYRIKGAQQLSKTFLEENGLSNAAFFSILVKENQSPKYTFDYKNKNKCASCRFAVNFKRSYKENDIISVYNQHSEKDIISETLTIQVPHLLCQNDEGFYEVGNKIGKAESLIILPEDWKVRNEEKYQIEDYKWEEANFRIIKLTEDFTDCIETYNEDGKLIFGKDIPLFWTEIQSKHLYIPEFEEFVYDVKNSRFTMHNDKYEGSTRIASEKNLQYRGLWQREWSSVPPIGKMYARASDANNNFYTKTNLIINIGQKPSIEILDANENICLIKITWIHGDIHIKDGIKKREHIWEIKRENCTNPHRIPVTFIPKGNGLGQFTLSLKAPFKEFYIMDIKGNKIANNSYIPYSDIDQYQYHLLGQNISSFKYGDIQRSIIADGSNIILRGNGIESTKSMPFEGALGLLFGSREELRSLLDRTAKNIRQATIRVTFIQENGEFFYLNIKEYPFYAQNKGGDIYITDPNRTRIPYEGALKLFNIDDPQMDPIIIYPKENGIYHLPEEIYNWDKPLLAGRTDGRILPVAIKKEQFEENIDFNKKEDGAINSRDFVNSSFHSHPIENLSINRKEYAISKISKELSSAQITSPIWDNITTWFDRIQMESIPASSILELLCVSQNPKFLIQLTFMLFMKSAEENENLLKEQLLTFSNDLAFQWYWLLPHIQQTVSILNTFISDGIDKLQEHEDISEKYHNWCYENGSKDFPFYLWQLTQDYVTWFKTLCVDSLVDSYEINEGDIRETAETIINENPLINIQENRDEEGQIHQFQGRLNDSTIDFFSHYDEPNRTPNEAWLCQRVNAVTEHIKGHINLFSITLKQEDVLDAKEKRYLKEEIRRSIIYCCKSSNNRFIYELNNKLAR